MRTAWALFLILGASELAAHEVRVQVTDENHARVSGAKVLIAFTTPVIGGEVRREGLTDGDGIFSGDGQAQGSVLVRVAKDGYYDSTIDDLPNNRELNLAIVLPRIVHPIPLYVLDTGIGRSRPPRLWRPDEVVGFDFEIGDAVEPYGKGKIADIQFRVRNRFLGWKYDDDEIAKIRAIPANRDANEEQMQAIYGKFSAELDISMGCDGGGLCEVKNEFFHFSRLKLPRDAPAEGYRATWHYSANNYSPPTARQDVGFFLRTRVKLDKDGRVISANFAKVIGDFRLDARGGVGFTYYYNPVPNDRNLEFDPARNLFPADRPGANVIDP